MADKTNKNTKITNNTNQENSLSARIEVSPDSLSKINTKLQNRIKAKRFREEIYKDPKVADWAKKAFKKLFKEEDEGKLL